MMKILVENVGWEKALNGKEHKLCDFIKRNKFAS